MMGAAGLEGKSSYKRHAYVIPASSQGKRELLFLEVATKVL
jgi:hypothetical protein